MSYSGRMLSASQRQEKGGRSRPRLPFQETLSWRVSVTLDWPAAEPPMQAGGHKDHHHTDRAGHYARRCDAEQDERHQHRRPEEAQRDPIATVVIKMQDSMPIAGRWRSPLS